MPSFYKGTKSSPYHLSVGAVLCDNLGRVACHYFAAYKASDQQELRDFRILMRETVEAGESLEQAVLRGISEEFGATGEVKKFLGPVVSQFWRDDVPIEKTTLYFLVTMDAVDVTARSEEDDESVSDVQWIPIDTLIAMMEEQGKRYERTDLNEAEPLRRAKAYQLSEKMSN